MYLITYAERRITMELKDLIGKSLSGFTVEKRTEVYRTNEDGRKNKSLGFFRDENIAMAFAGIQKDANWHKTAAALILTDGKDGFLLGESVALLNDEKGLLEVRERVKEKLTPEERRVLGIE